MGCASGMSTTRCARASFLHVLSVASIALRAKSSTINRSTVIKGMEPPLKTAQIEFSRED